MKGRDEKSIFIMFSLLFKVLSCIYGFILIRFMMLGQEVLQHLPPSDRYGNCDTARCQNVSWIPDFQAFTGKLKKGAKFLQPIIICWLPTSKCLVPSKPLETVGRAWDIVPFSSSETVWVCLSSSSGISQSFLTLALWTRVCARVSSGWW